MRSSLDGGIAQLGERLHGMQEVRGSIPRTSTKKAKEDSSGSPSSRGLGHYPFTVGTGVRIPVGMPVSAHAAELVAIPWRISRPQGAAWSELSLQFLPLALRWSPSSAGGRQATGAAPA